MAAYELMHFLHLRNSHPGLILAFSANLSVAIFIMRQTFFAIPKELEDSARIDGANSAAYLISMLPVIVVFIAMQKWFIRGLTEGILKF